MLFAKHACAYLTWKSVKQELCISAEHSADFGCKRMLFDSSKIVLFLFWLFWFFWTRIFLLLLWKHWLWSHEVSGTTSETELLFLSLFGLTSETELVFLSLFGFSRRSTLLQCWKFTKLHLKSIGKNLQSIIAANPVWIWNFEASSEDMSTRRGHLSIQR